MKRQHKAIPTVRCKRHRGHVPGSPPQTPAAAYVGLSLRFFTSRTEWKEWLGISSVWKFSLNNREGFNLLVVTSVHDQTISSSWYTRARKAAPEKVMRGWHSPTMQLLLSAFKWKSVFLGTVLGSYEPLRSPQSSDTCRSCTKPLQPSLPCWLEHAQSYVLSVTFLIKGKKSGGINTFKCFQFPLF